jgi:DNA topoisomerase-3
LILAEKPSVAMDFGKGLGISGKRDGYIEGNGYVITWAVGHLVELFEPQDYDKRYMRWSINDLPILPDPVKYKPLPKTKRQLGVIRRLLADQSLDRVVIATDAGREGEVIARTILMAAGFKDKSKLYRFWTSQALTADVVKTGMKTLKPATAYDRLWRAGQTRQVADWLVGMNGSRAATLKFRNRGRKDVYSIGRVQTAVLSLLVDRRRERENFKPKPYWLLRARFENRKGTWWGTWFKGDEAQFLREADAEAVLAKVQGKQGRVLSVRKEEKKQPPPLLYSLTDLQQEANRKFGFSAQKTLDTAQVLYEKHKCLSYPRTDSKVLGSKNIDLVKAIIAKLNPVSPKIFAGVVASLFALSNKRVFNDDKLTDHHALIPLAPVPHGASDDEKKIHDLVMMRFAAAFHSDCEYEQTEIVSEVERETFRTHGKRILLPGWRAVYGTDSAAPRSSGDEPGEKDLPPLANGEPAAVKEAKSEAKETIPPPEYTEALLLKDMTNPARYVTEEDLKRLFRGEVGLGTQATRAACIETLISRSYVDRRRKSLAATDKGCFLIEELRKLSSAGVLASPEETARWERKLEEIAQGTGSEMVFIQLIRKLVSNTVEELKMSNTQPPNTASLGNCPACGGDVIEGKKGFGCSNWKPESGGCKLVIWKEVAGKKLNLGLVRQLLLGKTVGPIEGFVGKTSGKTFSASLKLEAKDDRWQVTFDFNDRSPANAKGNGMGTGSGGALGKCPACGGDVVEGQKGYGCSNWRRENGNCRFIIWKTMAEKPITASMVKQLLATGTTDTIQGFKSKKGKNFGAKLRLDQVEGGSPKVVFDFATELPNEPGM